jgi:4-hydroxythreonine-4-phosphate dehydrogenase
VHGVPPDESLSVAGHLQAAGLNTARWSPGGAVPDDAQALVCDAESEADLEAIASAGAALPHHVVWAGSAGLARHLPAALGLRAPDRPGLPEPAQGPLLVLVGSRAAMARAQAAALVESGAVVAFSLAPGALPDLGPALDAGRDVLVRLPEELEFDPANSTALAQALGQLSRIHAARIGGLIAMGGDIARAALTALGAKGLYVVRELEPGVPLCVADCARPILAVTKSGSFGDRDTLARCHAALRGRTA